LKKEAIKLGVEIDDRELEKMVLKVDDEGDCRIEEDEFVELMGASMLNSTRSQTQREFSLIDTKCTGYIELSDLFSICTAIGVENPQAVADKIMKQVKPTIPGKISYEEFVDATN